MAINYATFCLNSRNLSLSSGVSGGKSAAQEDQVKDLEARVEQLKQKCKDLNEEHEEELKEERDKWKRTVNDLKEEHAEAIQLLRTEHTLLVDQVKKGVYSFLRNLKFIHSSCKMQFEILTRIQFPPSLSLCPCR